MSAFIKLFPRFFKFLKIDHNIFRDDNRHFFKKAQIIMESVSVIITLKSKIFKALYKRFTNRNIY